MLYICFYKSPSLTERQMQNYELMRTRCKNKSQGYGQNIMKKILMAICAVFGFVFYANADRTNQCKINETTDIAPCSDYVANSDTRLCRIKATLSIHGEQNGIDVISVYVYTRGTRQNHNGYYVIDDSGRQITIVESDWREFSYMANEYYQGGIPYDLYFTYKEFAKLFN